MSIASEGDLGILTTRVLELARERIDETWRRTAAVIAEREGSARRAMTQGASPPGLRHG
jgi:hypothetical protein